MGTLRRCTLTLSLVAALGAPAGALAAGPGDTLLASGPPGLGPLAPDAFTWNLSGLSRAEDQVTSIDVTDDGTRVAFASAADGMAPGLDPRFEHVFVKVRGGAITAIAPQANGDMTYPTISDDGTRVAFRSSATNLAPGDTSRDLDVFVADVATGTIALATPGTAQSVGRPVLSGNGQFVTFATREALHADDTNAKDDVYRVAADGTGMTLVSRTDATDVVGDGDSRLPTISDSGVRIAFGSTSTTFVAGDAEPSQDVYVRDVGAGTTTLVSRKAGVATSANGDSYEPRISGDGTIVAFTSSATDATAADADANSDVYSAPAGGGPATLVSQSTGGLNADGSAGVESISDNGGTVTFSAQASNLVPAAAGIYTVFVRRSGTTTAPFVPSVAYGSAVDGAGTYVATYVVDDLVGAGSPSSVTGATIPGGTLDLVSAPASGPLVPRMLDAQYAYYEGPGNIMSADGRYVVFETASPALAPGDPRLDTRCFRRDLRTGEVVLVSGGPGEPVRCSEPTISADGTKVAFRAPAALVPDGALGTFDVFVRDLTTGALTVASRADGPAGVRSDAYVASARMSADGRRIAFLTTATNLGAAGGAHVYVRDLAAGTTVIADRANGPAGAIANGNVEHFSIDADGSRVAFDTTATNLGDGDADATRDIFVRDVDAATTQLASRRSDADGGAKATNLSVTPWLSGDGDTVVFRSYGQNLDTSAGAWPTSPQLVERDLVARTTRVVSREGAGGALADASLGPAVLDHAGTRVAYEVGPPGTGGALGFPIPEGGSGIVLRDLGSGTQSLVAASVVDPGGSSAQGSRAPALTPDGSCLAFTDRTADLVPGVSPDFDQLFVRVLSGDCGTTTPGTPGPGPAPGPGTVAQTPAPRLTKVSLLRSRFRVGPRATAKTAAVQRRRTPAGTAFRFTLDRTATMRFVVERRTTGRRVGTTCRKATVKLRRRKACVRYVKVGTITRRSLKAGRRSVAFSGRLGKQRLKVGRHRVSMQATGTTGRRSSTIRRAFRVVAR